MSSILFLIPNLAHGGAERVLVSLVNNMDPERYDVTVQTLFDVGVNRQYLRPEIKYIPGAKHYFRGNSQLMKLIPARWLYSWIIKKKYDIVVSYLEGPTARIVAACPDKDTKKVGWIHVELGSPRLASVGFLSSKKALAGYDRYDKLVAVSQKVKDVFLESLPVSTPIDVLYNTNETEAIREKAKNTVSDPRFVTGDVPVCCSVAKLVPTKGFDRLLNVHKRLLDEGLAHRIYILGIGEQQKQLEHQIAEYGVGDSFVLLGFQDDPYKYVSKCDLYVCSSRREGFSTAVTEALIVGTPVVSTDCSGARELLGEQDEYGIVVENDEDGIYRGMKRMLEDPVLLEHYKIQAQLRGHFFSREKTVKTVEDMLDEL